MRVCDFYLLVSLISFSSLVAQSSNATSAYDVSSVRPHDPSDRSMSWRSDGDGFRAVNVDLRNAICSAWDIRPDQITGEPAWADDLHWDIVGKSTELTPDQLKSLTDGQKAQLMQQLLKERFHLQAHLETRTGQVLTLTPAKGGIKLTPITMTEEEKAAGKFLGTRLSAQSALGATELVGEKVPISLLIRNLAVKVNRTVIDNTGLPAAAVTTSPCVGLPMRV